MRKNFVIAIAAMSSVLVSGAAYAELDALKGLGKEAGKAVASSAKENVQGEKRPLPPRGVRVGGKRGVRLTGSKLLELHPPRPS